MAHTMRQQVCRHHHQQHHQQQQLRLHASAALGPALLSSRVVEQRRTKLAQQAGARGGESSSGREVDVVLSSGFLAFAHHSGFLQAVEEAGLHVSGVMGTSAGALAGSLYCAGYSPREVAAELSRDTPISLLRCSLQPWRGGVMSLDGVVDRLRQLLPATFEELDRDFAVGVVTSSGDYQVIDSGPLPEAVVASAAIPLIFEPVDIPGQSTSPFRDGGLVDRVGLKAWRERRRTQQVRRNELGRPLPPALVHVIDRSSPFSGDDDVEGAGEPLVTVVRSPRSRGSFLSLGDFEQQLQHSVRRARPAVMAAAAAASSSWPGGSLASSISSLQQAQQAGASSGSGVAVSSSASQAAGLVPVPITAAAASRGRDSRGASASTSPAEVKKKRLPVGTRASSASPPSS